MEYKPSPNSIPDALGDPWPERFTRWGERLRAARLDHLVGALLDIAEPLGPLGAQLLWVAQPTLGLFVAHTEIDSLARWLDEPDGVARLRAHLLELDVEQAGSPGTDL
ncbi:MAG: hypothetical protein JXA10_08810 [Anaerolineae bacterium]|nr:hypothetical protein [Anaerolineae bacterium]